MIGRNSKEMKWHLCQKCGGRVYNHRPDSHVCSHPQTGNLEPKDIDLFKIIQERQNEKEDRS